MARPDSEHVSRIAMAVCLGIAALLALAWLIGKMVAWWFARGD